MGWSNRPTGLTHYEPPHTYRGYTLFSPNGGDDAYLIDMAGNFVHRWHCDQGINYGFLFSTGIYFFALRAAYPAGPPQTQSSRWIGTGIPYGSIETPICAAIAG